MEIKQASGALTILCALSLSSAVHAAPSCSTNTCTGLAKELITAFFPSDPGDGTRRVVIASQPIKDNWTCDTNVWGNSFIEDSSVFDENYSNLLSAWHANAKITLRMNDAIQECIVRDVRLVQ